MSLLRRVAGLSFRDRVTISAIREELAVESALRGARRLPGELDEAAGERDV